MAERLVGAARQAALRGLRGWTEVVDADAIHRTFHFSSFREAWAFMTELARLIEQAEHYPEIFLYEDRVEVRLTSRGPDPSDVGVITGRDVEMAHAIDALAPERDAARTPGRRATGAEVA